jgi:hypothetical protein
MGCNCFTYQPLELDRKSISERIKITKQLKSELVMISKSSSEYKLYKCEACRQLWQSSFAWNWGNKEYLFKVPSISIDSWIDEPFMSPDEMLIYSAIMEDYYSKNSFETSEKKCKREDCVQSALINNVLCKEHFIKSLESGGVLPKKPVGRIFPPYEIRYSVQTK